MIALSEKEETLLNEYASNDAFGTEGQNDPRGDQRQGEYSMDHVYRVDD